MSFLAGYPQVTVYLLYTSALAFACALLPTAARAGGREAGARVGWAALGAALGVALAAHQLGPAFALTLEGTRTAAALPAAKVQPLAVGDFWSLEAAVARSGAASVGLPVLLWAPLAMGARRHRPLVLGLAALGVLSYAAAQGIGPVAAGITGALPGLGWFRYPLRMLVVTQLCVALLAAFGLHVLLAATRAFRDTPLARSRAALAAGVAAALAVGVALGLARAGQPIWAGLSAAAAPVALGLLHPRTRAPALAGAVALVVADVALPPSPVYRMPYLEEPAGAALMTAIAEAVGERTGEGRVAWLAGPPAAAVKLGALEELHMLEDYEPMTLRRHAEYFGYLQAERIGPPPGRGWFHGRSLAFERLEGPGPPRARDPLWRRRRLLDLASVTLVAWPRSARLPGAARTFLRDAGLRRVALPHEAFAAAENPRALPRAFVTYRARPAPPARDLLREISRPGFDPLAASYVEAAEGLGGVGAPARGRPARIVRDEARRVEIEAELEAPGLVVLGDTFASGWRASVDGEPAPILATNHLYRGVRVPAGRHRVRFDYRPVSFRAGVAVAACAALGWIALWRAGR